MNTLFPGGQTPATPTTPVGSGVSTSTQEANRFLGYDSNYSTRMGTTQQAAGLRALGAQTNMLSGPVASAVDQALARGNLCAGPCLDYGLSVGLEVDGRPGGMAGR